MCEYDGDSRSLYQHMTIMKSQSWFKKGNQRYSKITINYDCDAERSLVDSAVNMGLLKGDACC